ncbi:hypothetical protein J8M20_05725 [Pseudoalteromonas luteoviolacea]|uniref:hypothetical protein n=1 Tax=Pseudoalteromonas luteoviolacea TaxID=43657 RepID=UPI001B369D66|nr:hypothetical protein [Pseudoalteromonas luteoviolacea]MBQ4810824.1 hypothetical protein [Pseudoalteromonas luteoviolacea]
MQRSLIGLYLGVGFIAGLQVFHLWSGCNSHNSNQIATPQSQEQNNIVSLAEPANDNSKDLPSNQLLQEYIQAEIAHQFALQTEEIKHLISQLETRPALIPGQTFEENEADARQQETYILSVNTLDASIAAGYFDEATATEVMSGFNSLSDDQKHQLITIYSDAINAGKIYFEKPLIEFIN